jgi:arginine exporter protein ArgO
MKEIFFKGIAIALPLLVVGGVIYMIFHGFYSLYSDMRLKKELEQIQRESAERRRQRPPEERAKAPSPEDFFRS